MSHKALIIDDEADIRALIALSLDRIGLDTYTAANLAEARNLLLSYRFDVCLTDMRLPDGNGVEFVKFLQQTQPDLPVAVITAHGNMDAAVDAMKNGAFDFVSKPVDIKLLRQLVTQAIKSNTPATEQAAPIDDKATISHPTEYSAEATAPASTDTLATLSGRTNQHQLAPTLIGEGSLIGRSRSMNELRFMIAKVARTNAPIWITGESGTGKELIARLIHQNSVRAEAPFVAVNCGAIPSELMESEMFGHRKGSFTGAHTDHEGLFKQAEGGTLFLDEVAELPLSMQVKLLRALQERSIRPVGARAEVSTDIRILSASHKDLAIEVEKGLFRHDLYYRLNVICVKAPSLRERSDDVPDIARYILRKIASSDNHNIQARLSEEAEAMLGSYSFPGNVRELENILERATAMTDGAIINAADLDLNISHLSKIDSRDLGLHNLAANDASERELILNTLQDTRWNRKAAAVKLGYSYRQLRYRIQQYGIDEDATGTH